MPPKPKTDIERQQLRTLIIDAARELFVSKGVEAVTMREIAKEIMLRKDWDFENVRLWSRVTAAVKDCNKRRKVKRLAANSP